MPAVRRIAIAFATLFLSAAATSGQTTQNFSITCSGQMQRDGSRQLCTDRMEIVSGTTRVYADRGELDTGTNRAVLEGNVAISQTDSRIAADRAEIDVQTQMGTFYFASGVSRLQPRRQQAPSQGGIVVPRMSGQDEDVYFFGDKIEKLSSKRFRITNGGFTTCVQPTPRWNMHAGTVDLNVDSYTLLRNAVFNVKGVPLFYIPILYYPTQEDGRATGFLLPTYGSTTLLGQTIGNQFFWAIGRSHDATLKHEWYSRGGQGYGGEYRYALASGSGNAELNILDQKSGTNQFGGVTPATRSFSLRGGANQLLAGRLRARAEVDYFSSLQTMQSFNTDVYQASNGRRYFGGNVIGAWRSYSLNATVDRREQFFNADDSVVTGNLPRLSLNRNERPIAAGSPVYFSVNGEYAGLVREQRTIDDTIDSGLQRFDVTPRIRYPFKRWPFFTVNSSASWRETFYTRSLDPDTRLLVDESLNRNFISLQAQTLGPVFNRVWDTPDNGYAERFKHTIEPFANITWTSAVDNFDRIAQTDSVDTIVGGTTTINYGLNNRLYAKRRTGRASAAQEFLFLELSQTYYSNERAARFDPRYSTSFTSAAPNRFSPLVLSARAAPTAEVNGTVRLEVDSRYREVRTVTANGTYVWNTHLRLNGGWTRTFFIEELEGFNDPDFLSHYINGNVNLQTTNNHFGGAYSFNYDVRRSQLLQQRITGFYNAQCCGIALEYQTFSFGGFSGFGIGTDRRFFLSFTLAGLGNFSPMNGAMGGVPR